MITVLALAVRAAGAGENEITMNLGNKLGLVATTLLFLSVSLMFLFASSPNILWMWGIYVLGIVAFVLFIAAGVKGPRWWILAAGLPVVHWLFISAQGI